MKFQVGDFVVKTTGGPAMFVTDNINLTCCWVESRGYRTQTFETSELVTLTDWMTRVAEKLEEDLRRAKRQRPRPQAAVVESNADVAERQTR